LSPFKPIVTLMWMFSLGDKPVGSGLPRRVRDLIAAEEDSSERLIGWVQLAVVGMLGLLYLMAPRPVDVRTAFHVEPVPVVLGAYALITVGRLWLAYRRRLPGLLLLLSILIDVSLLVGLIWYFHIQYGQTAPFSLKVPTFTLLFVFVGVRALRFDHRYLLVAGLAAAVGWVLLVLAVLHESGTASITRSFVTHLGTNSVLIGAEIEKVVALLLVTFVLALSVLRGRRLFVTAIRDEAALADLTRFFGRGVSDTVVGAETQAVAGTAIERDAAILMLDIRGFTTMTAGLPPRTVIEILTGLHARIIPVVRQHGGVIDKFMGDGIMATFGAVQASPQAAADALRAIEAVMVEARIWQNETAVRQHRGAFEVQGAAVAGPVLFAVVGAGDRLEYTVIGEAVNLAAKLEKHNKIEGTIALTTAATLDLALRQGYQSAVTLRKVAARPIIGVKDNLDLVVLAA